MMQWRNDTIANVTWDAREMAHESQYVAAKMALAQFMAKNHAGVPYKIVRELGSDDREAYLAVPNG